MKRPNFNASVEDGNRVLEIVARAKTHIEGIDGMALAMDLLAAHNSCPMDLAALLAFDGFNFAHDVFGIWRHLDRKTGELLGGFVPRSALSEQVGAAWRPRS